MALRSLGSTLVAKASPGSALRNKIEERAQGAVADQAAGAQPTNVVRENVQQPLEKAVPEGSLKTVSVQPMMQPKNEASGAMQGQGPEAMGLVPQMGGAARAAETGRPISAPTGLRSATSSVAAAPVSSGANVATKLNETFGPNLSPSQKTSYAQGVTTPQARPTPTPTQVKNTPSTQAFNPIGFLEGTLGGRVSAADNVGKNTPMDFERNLAQGIAATLGGAIDKAGKFVGGFLPEMNVSENLQKFANNPSTAGITQNIQKGLSGAANTVSNAAKSVMGMFSPPAQTQFQTKAPAPVYQSKAPAPVYQSKAPAPAPKQNIIQKATSWLRSLFG